MIVNTYQPKIKCCIRQRSLTCYISIDNTRGWNLHLEDIEIQTLVNLLNSAQHEIKSQKFKTTYMYMTGIDIIS